MTLSSPALGGRTVATSASDLVAKIKALGTGDHTIGVADGHHGIAVIDGVNTGGTVIIVAENPGQAILEKMAIKRSKKITVRSLGGMPKSDLPFTPNVMVFAFDADTTTSEIIFDDCRVMGRQDAANHAYWTKGDWQARQICGFQVRGPNSHIRHCDVRAGRFAFVMGTAALNSSITDCTGVGLSGDGLRTTANGQKILRNRISDIIKCGDGNHGDACQGFGKPLAGGKFQLLQDIQIEDNILLEWTVRADNPLRLSNTAGVAKYCCMQGIGLFNAPYKNVAIRRNRIATAHVVGIAAYGVQGLILEDNHVWSVDHGTANFDTRWPTINVKGGSIASMKGNFAEAFGNLAKGSPVDYANLPQV